jgi:hypothetical protein
MLYKKVVPRPDLSDPPAMVASASIPESAAVKPAPAPEPQPIGVAPTEAKAPEPARSEIPPPVSPDPMETPVPAIEPVAEAPKAVDPPPRRIEGLGFDPKALEADRNITAPADPALSPAARDDRDLPREVDPDLLPPDPREARRRQEQRKIALARKVDEERVRFHTELRSICRKFREDSGPMIREMRQNYDLKIDPMAEKQAIFLLGPRGRFVGADRRTRIELLRSLGYPEPVILDNLYAIYEKQQIGARDGPSSESEAYYFSSLFLLRNPPRQAVPPARPVSVR